MAESLRFRTYNVQLSPEGYWQAFVSFNGAKAIEVNRRHGSWQTTADANGNFQDVPFVVAQELQTKVKALENPRPSRRKEVQEVHEARP